MREVNALYRIYGLDHELLYVGITNSPRGRMMDHVRSKSWARRIAYVVFEHFGSRKDLCAAERDAIATETPEFNVLHAGSVRDDLESSWVLEEYDPAPDRTEKEAVEGRAAAEVVASILRGVS